jgi:hypothetical protein
MEVVAPEEAAVVGPMPDTMIGAAAVGVEAREALVARRSVVEVWAAERRSPSFFPTLTPS